MPGLSDGSVKPSKVPSLAAATTLPTAFLSV